MVPIDCIQSRSPGWLWTQNPPVQPLQCWVIAVAPSYSDNIFSCTISLKPPLTNCLVWFQLFLEAGTSIPVFWSHSKKIYVLGEGGRISDRCQGICANRTLHEQIQATAKQKDQLLVVPTWSPASAHVLGLWSPVLSLVLSTSEPTSQPLLCQFYLKMCLRA